MRKWYGSIWLQLARHLLTAYGLIFLFFESYEVITNNELTLPNSVPIPDLYCVFLIGGFAFGLVTFVVDGIYRTGYLRREVVIPTRVETTNFTMKYGDIFQEEGWKAIGVNDFFDSVVDEDLVSSKSLHGIVLNRFWPQDRENWKSQIKSSLKDANRKIENRGKGNRNRYDIGTTARASIGDHNFLFAALGETDIADNTTSANTEMLIRAVRGMAREARAACSLNPLVVPLMGDGLARVGMHPTVLADLILTALVEESRSAKITDDIVIVIHPTLKRDTNLMNHVRKWAHAK